METTRILQRKCACGSAATKGATCAPCTERGQKEKASGDSAPESVHRVLRGSGQPLDPVDRGFMEQRFGHDFGRVRVHADGTAARSAEDVDAHAYTVGDRVVFGEGRYAPRTEPGRKLLAHELTHVLQQSGAARSPSGRITLESDPRLEDQAEAAAGARTVPWIRPSGKASVARLQRQEIEVSPSGRPKKPPEAAEAAPPDEPPAGCPDKIWAREFERVLRLDTVSVFALGGSAFQDDKQLRSSARDLCIKYGRAKHPFQVRVHYVDVDPRDDTGGKVTSPDAEANRTLGQRFGVADHSKVVTFVERDMVSAADFTGDQKLEEKRLGGIIEDYAISGAGHGALTGLKVGGVLGGIAGVATTIGAAAKGLGGGWAALLGMGVGLVTFGLTVGISALIGSAAGTDRGTKELTTERRKQVVEFVDRVRKTGEVKGDLTANDADDLARDAVNMWTESPASLPLSISDRRLLIRVMLEGATLDDDERAIIKIFEGSSDAEVLQLLDPTIDKKQRVSLQALDAKIDGKEWKQFRQMLAARFPTLGGDTIERKPDADFSCAADQAIEILAAAKRAEEVVQITLERLAAFQKDPAKNADVKAALDCYFPNATAADVSAVESTFQGMQKFGAISKYVCWVDKPGFEEPRCKKSPQEGAYDLAWTGVDPAKNLSYQQIGICSVFFDAGPRSQSLALVHEWFHRNRPGPEDVKSEPKCGGMQKAKALDNADSFARLAGLLSDDRTMPEAELPTVSVGNFRNSGQVTPENRCMSCDQIPSLGIDPESGANFMEVRGDISGHRPDAQYDFKRTKEVTIWERKDGKLRTAHSDPPGTPDDLSDDDEDLAPKDSRIYSIDGPGPKFPVPSGKRVHPDPKVDQIVYKANFVESVNVKVGNAGWRQSSNTFEWHSISVLERKDGVWRRSSAPDLKAENEIDTGHTSIPLGPGDFGDFDKEEKDV